VHVLAIPAATAEVEVRRTRRRWRFEARGAGLEWLQTLYPLSLRLASENRLGDLRPVRLVREGNNGGKQLYREARWHKRGRVRVALRRPGKKTRRAWRRTLPEAYDPLGLLFRMRWAAAAGELDHAVWHSFDGVWTRRVTVRAVEGAPPEEVEVPAGRIVCRRYEVRMLRVKVKGDRRRPKDPEDRTWTVWVSDDERHLPVLAQGRTPFGPARVALESWSSAPVVALAR